MEIVPSFALVFKPAILTAIVFNPFPTLLGSCIALLAAVINAVDSFNPTP